MSAKLLTLYFASVLDFFGYSLVSCLFALLARGYTPHKPTTTLVMWRFLMLL